MRRLVRSAVASLRPGLTSPMWPWVASARSLVSRDPSVVVPSARRVLALVPHPDDEVLAFGGTLHRLARRGATVEVVLLTDGEASIGTGLPAAEVGRRRRAEAAASCRALGLPDPVALGLPDGALAEHLDRAVTTIDARLPALEPELVFTTWFADGHRDHRAAAAIAAALALDDDVEVWGADVWTPLPPNHLVPLDDEAVAAKSTALGHHVTAAEAFDTSAILALDRYRSVQGLAGAGHAEGFLVADAATHREWVASAS